MIDLELDEPARERFTIEEAQEIGGAYVPPFIIAREDLTHAQKLVWGKVCGLAGKHGFCWATNRWLGESLLMEPRTVREHIQILVEKGLLRSEVIRNPNGEVKQRRLFPVWPQETPPPALGRRTPSGAQATDLRRSGDGIEKEQRYEKTTPLPPKGGAPGGADPFAALPERRERELDVALGDVLRVWNEQAHLPKHGEATVFRREAGKRSGATCRAKLRARLEDGMTVAMIQGAIRNLEAAIADPDCFWSHAYTLLEFLGRENGQVIERFHQGIEQFKRRKSSATATRNAEDRLGASLDELAG